MYSKEDFNKKQVEILNNHNVSEWEGYDCAIASYASVNRITELDKSQLLEALLEGGLDSWEGYERAMNEYDQYVDCLVDELKLTNYDKYVKSNNIIPYDKAEEETTPLDNNNYDYMETTELSLIEKKLRKLFPDDNKFQLASKVIDFTKNADFYTPKTSLGLEMLNKTKEIAKLVYDDNMTLNEYMLVAKPIFLAKSIKSGHLELVLKEYFEIK